MEIVEEKLFLNLNTDREEVALLAVWRAGEQFLEAWGESWTLNHDRWAVCMPMGVLIHQGIVEVLPEDKAREAFAALPPIR
jgi:hypothetical protein